MSNLLTNHLKETGMSYREHLFYALRVGLKAVISGFACMLHGFLPFIFVTTLSDTANELVEEFAETKKTLSRHRSRDPADMDVKL